MSLVNERTSLLGVASGVAALAAVGTLLMAVAHTGLTLPLLSDLGPSGRAVPPAIAAFSAGTVVFAAIAVGLRRRARWAWAGGLAVSLLAVLSGVGQFRGSVSAVGIAVALLLAALLLAPPSRAAVGR